MISMVVVLWTAIILVTYHSVQEYNVARENGAIEASKLAAISADHISQHLQTVDLFLQHAVERQHLNMLFGGNLPRDVINHFKLWVDSRPNMIALMIINDEGKTEVAVNNKSYANWINYDNNFKDFLPFAYLKKDDSDLQIIMPYSVKINDAQQSLLLIARRIDKLDGSFGGIVVAAIQAEYFIQFFSDIDNNNNRYLNVLMPDGKSLFGESKHRNLWTIKNDKQRDLINKIKDNSKRSGAVLADTKNNKDKNVIISFNKIPDLGLTVLVALDETQFLEKFWDERLKDLSFVALIVIFATVGAFFVITMSKQVLRVKKSEAAAILASQTKSEFLANMSHELRTPLNAIIGFSEMLTAGYFGPLNNKQKDRMGDITLCGNHLLQLINDILEFSKGEAGKLEIVEEKVNIFETATEASRIMQEKIKSKNINFKINVPDNFPRLFADRRKLKQVLINLLSNSIKFTPPNGNVEIKAFLENSGSMVIEVIDTGIGIAEEDIQTALDVFGQVHRSQSHEGTGLGLPLCRMFTELHNGKLTLISALGEGTTVRLEFPAMRIIEMIETPQTIKDIA
jgi:signal transduction histidine kinase